MIESPPCAVCGRTKPIYPSRVTAFMTCSVTCKAKRQTKPVLECCRGHRCDRCTRCLSGECCGADVGEANLPAEGEWPTPLFSALGELEERDGKVRCTLCGTWHVLLGRHVRWKHSGVSLDAYRSIAGLKSSRSLVPEHERLRRSQDALDRGLGVGMVAPVFTTEQRSILAFRREARAEVRNMRHQRPRDGRGRFEREINEHPVAVARLRPL